MEAITKTVKKYGNSGGVYLPNDWVGGRVRVELVEEPASPLEILGKLPLQHAISVIVYGSFARNEMTRDSDIDVILAVDEDAKIDLPNIPRYDIQIMTVQQLRSAMVHDPIFHKSISDSSNAIVNHGFLEDLKKEKLNMSGVRTRIDLAESALGITKSMLEYDGDFTKLTYSVILRIKEMIILECLFSGKKYTTKLLKKEILKSGIASQEFAKSIKVYRELRDNKKYESLPRDVILKMVSFLEAKIAHVKKQNKERN